MIRHMRDSELRRFNDACQAFLRARRLLPKPKPGNKTLDVDPKSPAGRRLADARVAFDLTTQNAPSKRSYE
jgi:hypothetical protein